MPPLDPHTESAHSRSLIRVFEECSKGSQGCSVSSGGNLRLGSACAHALDRFIRSIDHSAYALFRG